MWQANADRCSDIVSMNVIFTEKQVKTNESREGRQSIKSLSHNPGSVQRCPSKLHMNERQIIFRFLLPAYQQATGTVCPAMRSFDNPSSRLSALVAALFVFAALGDVGLVSATCGELLDGLANVAFVQTKMLTLMSARTRSADGDRVEGCGNQLLIVRIRAGDGNPQRDAASISEHRPFDAQLSAIGRVFPGFFPHPAATSLSRRPYSAIAIRYPCADRTCEGKPSRAAGRRPYSPTPESSDALCWASRRGAAMPSTDSLYAVGKRFHWSPPANSRAAARLCDLRDIWAATVRSAATVFPEFAQTYPANPIAYPPPCLRPEDSSSGTTQKVHICSVLG